MNSVASPSSSVSLRSRPRIWACRDVQSRDRLIGDQHVRFQRERARDHRALALASAERLGRTPVRGGGQPDELEQLLDVSPLAVAIHEPVHARGFADRRADGHAGVERGIRILEDHLHALAHRPELRAAEREQLAALEADAALVRLDQAQHAAGERGLAAARLPHHAQHFAATQLQRDPVHGHELARRLTARPLQRRARHGEALAQPLDLEDRRTVGPRTVGPRAGGPRVRGGAHAGTIAVSANGQAVSCPSPTAMRVMSTAWQASVAY